MRLELHRHWILTGAAVCILSVSLLHNAAAEEAEAKVKVGQAAPEFKLQDQNGQAVRLQDLIEDRPTAVVFHRSADW